MINKINMIGVTVMSSKIENVIGEIEDYLADCKAMPFSSTKICVEKIELIHWFRN